MRINKDKKHSGDGGGMAVIFKIILNGCCNATGDNSCNPFRSATDMNEKKKSVDFKDNACNFHFVICDACTGTGGPEQSGCQTLSAHHKRTLLLVVGWPAVPVLSCFCSLQSF